MQPEEQLINRRIEKLGKIKKLGINPYPYKFEANNFSKDILEKYSKLKNEEKTNGIKANGKDSIRPFARLQRKNPIFC